MQLPVIYVMTHDSIGLGEDGPTHQPVEHLASLRAMPQLYVIRPADANETAYAWRAAMQRTEGPTMLILTRQKVPIFDPGRVAGAEDVLKGAYIQYFSNKPPPAPQRGEQKSAIPPAGGLGGPASDIASKDRLI